MCVFARVGKLTDGKPEGCYVNKDGTVAESGWTEEMGLLIPTLEGLLLGRQNDWIIKGVKGEFYPCKPDIFEQTYEEVKDG
jgi:hypothetical protein